MENSFKIFIAVIVFLIVLLFLIKWYYYNLSKSIKGKVIEQLKTAGKVFNQDNKTFLKLGNENYEIMYYYLRNGKELSINSPRIWEEKSHKSTIVNQSAITKSNGLKIIIVYPSTNKITRYINENEIEFVNNQLTYNFYIVTYNNLDSLIKKLKGD